MNPGSCEESFELLNRHLSGELPPEDAPRLKDHLSSCPECRSGAEELLWDDRALAEMAAHERLDELAEGLRSSLAEEVRKGSEPANRKQKPSRPATRQPAGKPRAARTRTPWGLVLAAAGVVVGLALVLILSSSAGKGPGDRRQGARELVSEKKEERSSRSPGKRPDEATPQPKGVFPAPDAKDSKVDELKRKAEDAFRKIQEDRRAAAAGGADPETKKPKLPEKKKDDPEPPAPPPDPEPVPRPEKGAEEKATRAAVARLEGIQGDVHIIRGGEKIPVQDGQDLLSGERLETVGVSSRAAVVFPDHTRIELWPGTALEGIRIENGKRIGVLHGALTADVAKQPAGKPLVISTPQGEATVLGTTLRIVVEGAGLEGSTRLDVTEGRVRLSRKRDGKEVYVRSGHTAVAAEGVLLSARRIAFGSNLLVNAGFENDGQGWQKPISGVRSIVSRPVHSGARAHQIQVDKGGAEVWQLVPVEGRRWYEAAGWLAAEGLLGGGVRIEVWWLNSKARGLDPELIDTLESRGAIDRQDVLGPVNGFARWRRVSRTLRAPATATTARFRFIATDASGSGTGWIDDLSLREVK